MANSIFRPHEFAYQYMLSFGINPDDFFNLDGTINKRELAKLYRMPPAIAYELHQTIVKASKQFQKSETLTNEEINHVIDLRLANAASYWILEHVDSILTPSQKRQQIIKWIPSEAKKPDIIHAAYYGKVMTYQRARQLELGTRYGCKCAMQFVNQVIDPQDIINEQKSIINGT